MSCARASLRFDVAILLRDKRLAAKALLRVLDLGSLGEARVPFVLAGLVALSHTGRAALSGGKAPGTPVPFRFCVASQRRRIDSTSNRKLASLKMAT